MHMRSKAFRDCHPAQLLLIQAISSAINHWRFTACSFKCNICSRDLWESRQIFSLAWGRNCFRWINPRAPIKVSYRAASKVEIHQHTRRSLTNCTAIKTTGFAFSPLKTFPFHRLNAHFANKTAAETSENSSSTKKQLANNFSPCLTFNVCLRIIQRTSDASRRSFDFYYKNELLRVFKLFVLLRASFNCYCLVLCRLSYATELIDSRMFFACLNHRANSLWVFSTFESFSCFSCFKQHF